MFDFREKVVMVTGATGSLGKALAEAFYQAGANLVLGDRQGDQNQSSFPESERVFHTKVDLLQPTSVQSFMAAALERFGQIDVLANTVGGFRGSNLVHTSPEQWDYVLDLNLRTAFIISQAVLPPMLDRGAGKIIHVSARAGLSGGAGMAAYSASKSALIRLVESLSAEVRLSGLNVNCVLPGTLDTPENRQDRPDADHSRWVPLIDIANVILFLASDAAKAVTGASIPVYGKS